MAGWWLWNYYMQSPWTRDGKIRAEQVSITPQVSGSISALLVKDNQYVHAGDVLFRIDETPFHIAVLNAQAQLAKAQSDLAKANNEAERRRHLSRNYISAEDLDTANINVKAMQASLKVAEATLKQAEWQLTQTVVKAPVDGWITSLSTRVGNYATTGQPVFALVDSHSFYVVGYFEETKLRHIREVAQCLPSRQQPAEWWSLRGHLAYGSLRRFSLLSGRPVRPAWSGRSQTGS
ncbi:HlyD family secretion protein [Enterobacter hormaechei]|nr:HlyD family secretion protein [Enterobacter hormaechei]